MRQAANLRRVKRLLQVRLARRLAGGGPVWLVDSLPVHACQSAQASFCRRFRGQADHGYRRLRKRTFYGFRPHLRVSRDGVTLAYRPAPARHNEKAVPPEMGLPAGSVGVGHRNYRSPELRDRLAAGGRLAERYGVKRAWTRDWWHRCHRIIRKALSHAAAALLNLRAGHEPMQLDLRAA